MISTSRFQKTVSVINHNESSSTPSSAKDKFVTPHFVLQCNSKVKLQSMGRSSRYKNSSKNNEKCCLPLDILSCVKIKVFRLFFAFRLEIRVRCGDKYKTGADGGTILGQPMLFDCMGVCVLSPTHCECEMRGSLVNLLIMK